MFAEYHQPLRLVDRLRQEGRQDVREGLLGLPLGQHRPPDRHLRAGPLPRLRQQGGHDAQQCPVLDHQHHVGAVRDALHARAAQLRGVSLGPSKCQVPSTLDSTPPRS